MAVTFAPFDSFMGFLGDGTIDLDSDTFKAVLTNTAPTLATDTVLTDITQISGAYGYSTGGVTLTGVAWTEVSAGVWRFDSDDFEWEASGGSIGPFQYVPIYSDTAASDELVGRYDFGSALTVPDGSFFRVQPGTNGYARWGVGTIA